MAVSAPRAGGVHAFLAPGRSPLRLGEPRTMDSRASAAGAGAMMIPSHAGGVVPLSTVHKATGIHGYPPQWFLRTPAMMKCYSTPHVLPSRRGGLPLEGPRGAEAPVF